MNRLAINLGFCVAMAIGAPCSAQWWWPPTDGLQVSPSCISPAVQVSLTVSGEWPDSCIPNSVSAVANGSEIDVFTVRDPPPGICLSVISNWSLTATVGPLAVGTYTVFATHRVAGQSVHPRTQVGTVTVVATCGAACYANCDQSTGSPVLTPNDFSCFLNSFAAGESYANCDGSTGSPALTTNDFACFITRYVDGCS